jgi:hypothetical protein
LKASPAIYFINTRKARRAGLTSNTALAFFVHNLRRLNFRMGDDLRISSLRAHQERITLLFGHHRMSFNCQLR